MNCPSCGAELEVDSRFAHLVVCESCDSSLVLDAGALKLSGKMSTLKPPRGRLYVGARGQIGEAQFQVLGRVRYGYLAGVWDEWFLGLDDGDTAWISEDEDDLQLETMVQTSGLSFQHQDLGPGTRVQIQTEDFTVTEREVAICEGGQGQLPFPIFPGESVPFVELTGDRSFATLEFEDDGIRLFLGRRLEDSQLELEATREEVGLGQDGVAPGLPGSRERVVRGQEAAQKLKCISCAAPIEAPAEGAKTHRCEYCGAETDLGAQQIDCPSCARLVQIKNHGHSALMHCPHCRAQIDLSRDQPSLLGTLANRPRPPGPFKLGQKGTLKGRKVEIVGHIHVVERDAWGGVYPSDEYYLHVEDARPFWLTLEKGHFALGKETHGQARGMSHPRQAIQRSSFLFGKDVWTVFEVGEAPLKIEYVAGELPWVAQLGDTTRYMDAIAPPKLLSAEWTESELEWFEATYLERDEVIEGFGLDPSQLPPAEGVSPCQPYRESELTFVGKFLCPVLWVLAMMFLVSSFNKGRNVASLSMPGQDIYQQEFISDPFEITEAETLVQMNWSTNVDNAWMYIQYAVLDVEDRAVVEDEAEASYYHGYEGGEYWTEGSRSARTIFKLSEPGEYRLLVYAEGGVGEGSGNLNPRWPVRVQIDQGIELSRYYGLFALLLFGLSFWFLSASFRFEATRWAPVTESDDDD